SRVQAQTSGLASADGVRIDFDVTRDQDLVVPRELLEDALAEVIANAIEAPRPEDREPQVLVSATTDGTEGLVQVIDNGTGLAGVTDHTALADVEVEATKGRPAEGLQEVSNILTFVRGGAQVQRTSNAGTRIDIRFPYRVFRN